MLYEDRLAVIHSSVVILTLGLTLLASIFLIKGNVTLSVNDIAKISETHWDWSKEVAKNLTGEKADTMVGFILLLSCFFLQLGYHLLFPIKKLRAVDYFVLKRWGWISSVIILGMVCGLGWFSSHKLQQNYYFRVEQIIQNNLK